MPRRSAVARAWHLDALSALGLAILLLSIVFATLANGSTRLVMAGVPQGAVSVVICTNGTTQTILLDQNGKPVDPEDCQHEMCPACLTPPLAAIDNVPATQPRSLTPHRLTFVVPSVHHVACNQTDGLIRPGSSWMYRDEAGSMPFIKGLNDLA